MNLSSEDRHIIQSNPKHIPHPAVNNMLSSRFYLPIGLDITYESGFLVLLVPRLITLFSFHYLLENEKLLLVLVDREKVSIYLARPAALEAAIRGNPLKTLNRDKLGLGRDSDVFFAFDEAKRMLAVCSSVKVVRSRSSKVAVLTRNYQ